MKRISTIFFMSVFAMVSLCAQTTIVDFENPADYTYVAWEGTSEVVTNTVTDGLNSSSTCGKYVTPSGKAWGNAAVVILNNPLQYKNLEKLSFLTLAPSASMMYVKLEVSTGGAVAEAYATPTSSGAWQLVNLGFTTLDGVDVETAIFDKLVFFFNANDAVGGENWLFDNVVLYENIVEPSAPTNLQVSNMTSDSFTLTWDNDANATDGTNIFIAEQGGSDIYITTVGAGTNSYVYTGTYGDLTIQQGKTYIAKVEALPDADWNAYSQIEVQMTSTDIDLSSKQSVVLAPNPVQDFLTVLCDSKIQSIEVFNMSGELVRVSLSHTVDDKIYMGDYPRGIYLVKVKCINNIVYTAKITKQ